MVIGEVGQVGLLVVLDVTAVKLPEQGNVITQVHQTAEKTVRDRLTNHWTATLILAPVC